MSKTASWYINCAISISLMLFVRFIPAPAPITPLGMAVVGIFIGAIYGWCTTNMIWPSIFALTMLAFTVNIPLPQIWGGLIGNGVVSMLFWLFLSIGLLSNTGLTEWIARWSMTREFTKGKPWMFMTVVILSDVFCAFLLHDVAVTVVFWGLIWSMCESVGYEKTSKTGAWACFTVAALATFAAFVLPFKPAVITNFGFLASASGGTFDGTYNYVSWIAFTLVMFAIVFVAWMLVSRFVIKVDLQKFAEFDSSSVEVVPMSLRQKISLFLFAALFVLMFLPSFIPAGTPVAAFLNSLGIVGFCMIVVGLGCMLRIEGEPLLTFADVAAKNLIWNVIFMFGTALTVAGYINNPTTGIGMFLSDAIGSALGGFGPLVFVIAYLLIAALTTNVINNAIVGAIMVPISYALCVNMGVNPIALTACIICFSDFGFLLPSSAPIGALMHNNNGWIPRATIYRYGAFMLAVMVIAAFIVGWPLANMLFPFAV